MRAIFVFLFSITTTFDVFGQRIAPQIDKRVEILSIISRLAEYGEYNQKAAKKYISDIHSYFNGFKNDTLIRLAIKIRNELEIGFDAVMSMAVNLKLENGKFSLQSNWKNDLDKRWTQKVTLPFVDLLNRFYLKTKAEIFFKNEASYYNYISKAFDEILTGFHQQWYYDYYGIKPNEKFSIVIGCGNGGANYGVSITDSKLVRHVYAIMGSWSFDKNDNPIFNEESYLPTLIHEFNHSFINPLLTNNQRNTILKHSMQIILDTMSTEMKKQAYSNWETVFNESLVRASVIRYLIRNSNGNPRIVENEIIDQTTRGFLWIKNLVDLLGVYEANRAKYPTIAEFYPRIISFFESTSDSISAIKNNYEMLLPKVMSLEPFDNYADNVDPGIKEMTINFNQTMKGEGYSNVNGGSGKDLNPVKSFIGYTNNGKSIKLELELKPGTAYEVNLTGRLFKNIEGYPLKNYTIKFKTKK